MANILDYIKWRGDLSLEYKPLNPVDNLILARLAYIDFDDLPIEGEKLESISSRYIDSEVKMNPGIFLNEGTKPLLDAVGNGIRFKDLIIKNFINKIDVKEQIQFSAVTFKLNEKTVYVAFRGTDDSLVGWKEDFNMSFMEVVPAQLEAVSYLKDVTSEQCYEKVYVGGHSKGGNLAVFASLHLPKELKVKIDTVYNNDGPGFKSELLNTIEYKEMADRIMTLIPKGSVVGLMLEHEVEYKVIESKALGLKQHDGFTWEVMGEDFVYLEELDYTAKIIDKTTKRMLEKMDSQQREAFATVIFDVLSIEEKRTLTDLNEGGLLNLLKISKNYRNLDKNTKDAITGTLSLFLGEGYHSFKEVTELNQWKDKMRTWQSEAKQEMDTLIENSRFLKKHE